jgi:hypothetical protein
VRRPLHLCEKVILHNHREAAEADGGDLTDVLYQFDREYTSLV